MEDLNIQGPSMLQSAKPACEMKGDIAQDKN